METRARPLLLTASREYTSLITVGTYRSSGINANWSCSRQKGAVFKSNQIDGAEVALAAARRAGAKFVARCGYLLSAVEAQTHGADSRQTKSARKLENEVFTQADWICVTTQAMALAVQEDYSVPIGQISIVPNYVDIDRFKPMPQPDVREKVRVGFVGRLAWEKNLEPLIGAA